MKTILVVDDNHSNLKLAQELLSAEYKVITVDSGEKALIYLSKKHADLALLDIYMPDMDGVEVMKKIQENPEWAKMPVIFLTADINAATEVQCFRLGALDFIGKPFVPEVMISRIGRILELQEYRNNLEVIVRNQTKEIVQMQIEVMNMQQEVIIGMANLIESRDGSTGEHVKRTNLYVELIVSELRKRKMFVDTLTDDYVKNLCKAAAMHDIGKIKVPDNILQKPGKLTEEEFEVMKQHSLEGGKIIKETMDKIENRDYIDMAYEVAVYHHEKWDGHGYPNGLKGNAIPLSARIMAVADVFDALVSKRCYKEQLTIDEAFEIIEESKGNHFDAQIVDVFLQLRPQIEAIMQEGVA